MNSINNMTFKQCELLLTAESHYFDKKTKTYKEYGAFARIVLLSHHLQNISVFFRKVAWMMATGNNTLITNEDIAKRLTTLLESPADEAQATKLEMLAKRTMLCVGDTSAHGQELKRALDAANTGI